MEEKKACKVTLGTAISIFLIFILLICLGILAYINYNNSQELEKTKSALASKQEEFNILLDSKQRQISQTEMSSPESEIVLNSSDIKTVNETSDIQFVYDILSTYISEGMHNYLTIDSGNKIENFTINGITIYSKDYASIANFDEKIIQEIENENSIVGHCSFSIKFKDITKFSPSGSKGDISGIIGDWFIDDKEFVVNKSKNTIEFITGY